MACVNEREPYRAISKHTGSQFQTAIRGLLMPALYWVFCWSDYVSALRFPKLPPVKRRLPPHPPR
jgi:hypothetical protein